MSRWRLFCSSYLLACLLWLPVVSLAQSWPKASVRIVVPYVPGGTTDIVARVIAQELSKGLGQQFIVDNRAGASTQLGTDLVAKAKPDGYTLLLTAAPFAINPSLYPKLPYDTAKDFEPVTLVVQNALFLVAYPSAPSLTLQGMLDVARKRPGSLQLASVGNGTMSHMSLELLAALAKVDITHVPYKGSGQALPDVMGGQVQYLFDNPSSALPYIRSGKLKAIAYTGRKRSAALPQVPTIAESGLAEFETVNWFGLLAPAGTPAPVLDRLNTELASILKRGDIRDRFAKDGVETVGGSRAEFAAFLRAEIAKWARIVKERNIQPG